MDGFEFLAALRAKRDGSEIPIVVLTAKDLSESRARAARGRDQAVLRKSMHSRDELAAELRRALKPDARSEQRLRSFTSKTTRTTFTCCAAASRSTATR